MKKLLALLTVGSVLALTTGCPPAPTTESTTTTKSTTASTTAKSTTEATTKPSTTAAATTPETTKPATTPATTPAAAEKTAKGTVVKVEKESLTYKNEDGKEVTVKVPADAKVTLDGKEDKLDSLKAGSDVSVTAKGDAATKVEGKAAAAPPPPPPPPPPAPEASKPTEGKVVSAEKGKLVVTVDGKEKTYTVPDDAKVTGADKLEAIKKDAMVTVTEKDGKVTAVDVKK